jgi:hypothetical protein
MQSRHDFFSETGMKTSREKPGVIAPDWPSKHGVRALAASTDVDRDGDPGVPLLGVATSIVSQNHGSAHLRNKNPLVQKANS